MLLIMGRSGLQAHSVYPGKVITLTMIRQTPVGSNTPRSPASEGMVCQAQADTMLVGLATIFPPLTSPTFTKIDQQYSPRHQYQSDRPLDGHPDPAS